MDNRSNTIAGWVLGSCMVALGLTIASGKIFDGGRPEKMGYPIEGVADATGGAAADVPIATLLGAADPAKGADVFKKCAACHTIDQGAANGIGPNLYATVGEAIAQGKNGFAFSDALKAHAGKWDFDSLNAWLTSPRKYASGTKMTFAGLGSAQDRANVIVYLNSKGSNLPIPAVATAATLPANPGGKATPNAANLAKAATPAPGAPSQDPNAAVEAAKDAARH